MCVNVVFEVLASPVSAEEAAAKKRKSKDAKEAKEAKGKKSKKEKHNTSPEPQNLGVFSTPIPPNELETVLLATQEKGEERAICE